MRALALSLAAFLLAATQPAFALERLTLQLRGEPDAAAAGYIIAHERGIFADHGLDVSIKPGGSLWVFPLTIGGVTVSPDQGDGGVLCARSQSYPMIGNNEL